VSLCKKALTPLLPPAGLRLAGFCRRIGCLLLFVLRLLLATIFFLGRRGAGLGLWVGNGLGTGAGLGTGPDRGVGAGLGAGVGLRVGAGLTAGAGPAKNIQNRIY